MICVCRDLLLIIDFLDYWCISYQFNHSTILKCVKSLSCTNNNQMAMGIDAKEKHPARMTLKIFRNLRFSCHVNYRVTTSMEHIVPKSLQFKQLAVIVPAVDEHHDIHCTLENKQFSAVKWNKQPLRLNGCKIKMGLVTRKMLEVISLNHHAIHFF